MGGGLDGGERKGKEGGKGGGWSRWWCTTHPSLFLDLGWTTMTPPCIAITNMCVLDIFLLSPHPSFPPSLPPVQTWLMDGATYPIIVIITFAVTMCSSFTAYKFFNSPDNRVDPRKRTALMRDWTK